MNPAWLVLLAITQAPEAPAVPKLAVGLTVGEPNGFSVAAPVAQAFSVHLGAGLSTSAEREALVTFDVVYMFHDVIGAVMGVGWMKPWFGVGARYADARGDERSDQLGARIPFGISYYDRTTPIEVFALVAWGIVLIPEREGSVEITFGLRFGL